MDSKQLQKIIDEEFKKAALKEGFLDKLKFAVSKLPNLERSRGPQKDAAIKQVGKIIDNESDQRFKEMIKALNARLPGFPNVEKHEDFLLGMEEFAMLYDGIVEQFNDGKIEAPTANVLIGDLRVIVKKFLDYDLKDVYKHFKEHQEKIDEALPFTNQAKIDKELERQKYDAEGGPIGREFGDESETIKGLQSNVLPKVLAMGGIGPLLGGAAWFREILNAPGVTPDTIIDGAKRVFATVEDGEGFSQTIGRYLHNNPGTYSENFGARNFFENVKSLGITPSDPGPLQQAADNPSAFRQEWATIADKLQANPDATMSDVFPASNKAFWIEKGAQIALGKLPKVIGGAAAGAGGGAAAGAAAAGVFGAGLLASAAAVKLLRMKGMKSSRAQVFKDMLATFKDVEPVTPQQKQLQSGLEDIGVIPQDTVGEPEEQAAEKPEGSTGVQTSTGDEIIVGGNYNYVSSKGQQSVVQVRQSTGGDNFRVSKLDKDGKPVKNTFASRSTNLGAPSTDFPSIASRAATASGATTGGGSMTPEDQDEIRKALRLLGGNFGTTSQQRRKYVKDITNLLVKSGALGKLARGKAMATSDTGETRLTENFIETLRKLKKDKVVDLDENQINKIETQLKEDEQKLIEEQKIYNHWKKHAGLLKG